MSSTDTQSSKSSKPSSLAKKIGKSLLYSTGVSAAKTAALFGLTNAMASKLTKDPVVVGKLLDDSYKKGDISSPVISTFSLFHPLLKHNAFFKPESKRVFSSHSLKDTVGVIAHELGHAANNNGSKLDKLRMHMYSHSKKAPGLASLINGLFAKKLTTKQMLGIDGISTGLLAPTLIEEGLASYKGYKKLRDAGLGRLTSLGAFSGLPSYLLHAASPYIQTAIQHKVGLTKDTWDKK